MDADLYFKIKIVQKKVLKQNCGLSAGNEGRYESVTDKKRKKKN